MIEVTNFHESKDTVTTIDGGTRGQCVCQCGCSCDPASCSASITQKASNAAITKSGMND